MQTSSPPLIGEARVAELIRAYLVAEYRWELDGRWLNLRIGEPSPEAWAYAPEARSMGLLSAWDPYSIPRPDMVNRAADQSLHRELIDGGLPFRAAFSSATNRTWREPSWLVAGQAAPAFDAMSRRYGQLATLYWTPGQPVRLRVDASRPEGFTDDRDIDWLR
jgi:Protein of unknown function (DUF3293)